jgi:hypothetical protein
MMSSHKHHEHLQKIKTEVENTTLLTQEEKSNTIKHIEEWVAEDKAEGIFFEELLEITQNIRPLLAELGLI